MNEELKGFLKPGKQNLILIYILYIGSLITPILCLIGFIMAYINRDSTKDNSHYIFLCRTFWISLIISIIAAIGKLFLIGFFISLALKIWYIIRMIIGMNFVLHNKPHPHPDTLLVT